MGTRKEFCLDKNGIPVKDANSVKPCTWGPKTGCLNEGKERVRSYNKTLWSCSPCNGGKCQCSAGVVSCNTTNLGVPGMLTAGQAAGVTISVLVMVCVCAGLAFFYVQRKKALAASGGMPTYTKQGVEMPPPG